MDFYVQNGKFNYKHRKQVVGVGNSHTKWEFQITNEIWEGEMGFLDYKRESRFTIHQVISLLMI